MRVMKFGSAIMEITMPSLEEVYQRAVERGGENSKAAIMLKKQLDAQTPKSAERLFVSGAAGPKSAPTK